MDCRISLDLLGLRSGLKTHFWQSRPEVGHPLLGLIHEFAGDHCPENFSRLHLVWADCQNVGIEHRLAGHGLGGIEDALVSFPCFCFVYGAEDVRSGDWPITSAGDDSAVIQDRARGILPFVNFGIDVGLEDLDRIVGPFGPVQLKSADEA